MHTLILDVGQSLRLAFFMFWATLWPIVFGFGLSGAVQAFVSRASLQRAMGDHRPGSVVRASAYGAASSSCSYAASAMSKSLFMKGADFIAANVFLFASTNLVVELGAVLVVLMGWQFAISEFIGGTIMIVLFVGLGSLWLRGRLVTEARARLNRDATTHDHHDVDERVGLMTRLKSPAGWADSASYTLADIRMLRKELIIGYVVAGILATVVPVRAWNALFLHGHGVWTTLENVIVAPAIAIASFVCSIGNVPLAAALWSGGISFGGVVAFIFADLITLPLLLIYRRFYGGALAVRMLVTFWVVMSTAGLITEELFQAVGMIPTTRTTTIVPEGFAWNLTTYLNIVFIVVFGVLVWLARNRARFGGGQHAAVDPVCGMQVERATAPATATIDGTTYYFCSDHCHDSFRAQGQRAAPSAPHDRAVVIDPICGMHVDPATASAALATPAGMLYFCSTGCHDRYVASNVTNTNHCHHDASS